MSRTSALTKLPAFPVTMPPTSPPCDKCTAMCCRYFAMEIDAPEDAEDFDAIKWYLLHDATWVWVDDGDWYVQVDRACRMLLPNGMCKIYETRPQICRDYGMPEHLENPDDPLCDYFAQELSHDHEFREVSEVEAYARKFLRKKAADKRKRSVAAKKAWAKRRQRA